MKTAIIDILKSAVMLDPLRGLDYSIIEVIFAFYFLLEIHYHFTGYVCHIQLLHKKVEE